MLEDFLLAYVPRKGRCAVDVGANVGEWSAALAQRFERVIAVEPNPALTNTLRRVAPNVSVLAVGAWSTAGVHDFTLYASDKNTSALGFRGGNPANDERGSATWLCARLDDLVTEPVDFMKVDVEGAEVHVLNGAQRILTDFRPHLLIEVHGEQNGADVVRLLEQMRYTVNEIRNPLIDPACDLWRINYWIQGRPL